MPTTASSIVMQLQDVASSSDGSIGEVVRKAHTVAMKLGLADFNQWLKCEMHGYFDKADKLADYRIIRGDVRLYNRIYMPIRLEHEIDERLSTVKCRDSIGHLVDLANGKMISYEFSLRMAAWVLSRLPPHLRCIEVPFKRFSPSPITSILNKVRSSILDWSLKLEKQGILGEGMTFNEKEKEAATFFNISNHAPVGSIDNYNTVTVHQGDFKPFSPTLATSVCLEAISMN
jgi:hypothetical protein